MTKITWEVDADGLEGFVGTDDGGQWWGRVDVGAELLGPYATKEAAIEAYQDADPQELELRRLMHELDLAEPPDGWQERLAELFAERFGDDEWVTDAPHHTCR